MMNFMKRNAVLHALGHAVNGFRQDLRFQITKRQYVYRRPGVISTYLASHPVKKLQLGAGPVGLDGWLNTDLRPRHANDIFLDARDPFPFDDATFDYIFAEHFVQDLPYQITKSMLRECCRVLKPGGKIRLAVPNLWSFANLCGGNRTEPFQSHIRWYVDNYFSGADGYAGGFVVNNLMREVQFLFDPETLRLALEKGGFDAVVECPVGHSDDEHLRNLESHGKVLGCEAVNQFETLVMEALRPSEKTPVASRQAVGASS